MEIVCLDLEGVLVPEIWIEFAEATGIKELKATTRDIPDYRELMERRLGILHENRIGLSEIQETVAGIRPLEGAREFLDRLRESHQVIILSDTFYEFAAPLMRQLGWPTLFCHRLETDAQGAVSGYKLRLDDHKREAVRSFKKLNFRVIAAGDSYNDINMLREADQGFLFRPPKNVIKEFPGFPVVNTYAGMQAAIGGNGK